MKKYSSIFIIVVVIVVIFVMFVPNEAGEYAWNPFDYARITEVDYKAVVVDEPGSNGKIVVTERLTFDIHAFSTYNLFWELWRDLSEDYVDGVKVDFKVLSVKQIFDDGREPEIFTESPKLYWYDDDYINTAAGLGPGKWYHSAGPYNESSRQYECVLFYVDGLYREKVVFEIEYEMYNAALRWADSSELYISLFSEKNINFLKSFKGQILFPEEKMPNPENYYVNTYGTNAHSFPLTESATMNPGYHTFSFELTESQLKFRPYNEYIEFALVSYGEDNHIFTQNASKNIYYNDDVLDEIRQEQAAYEALPKKFKTIKTTTLLFLSVAALLIIKHAFAVGRAAKKKYTFYQPIMQMDYFRDIPGNLDPSFAAELVFCKHKSSKDISDGYAAVMLSLVRKGYIELKERNSILNKADIIIKYKPTQELAETNLEPLTQTEELYFNLISRYVSENVISMATFQARISADYQNTTSFVKNISKATTNIGVSQGYFQKADYKMPRKQLQKKALVLGIIAVLVMTLGNVISYQTRLDLAFGAFFALGMGFIIGAVYLFLLSKECVLLTQFGEDEYAKWRGLYRFLDSETLMNERTVIELTIWEQYLIYATAFGIAEKVIKALKIRCAEMNLNTSPVLCNRYFYSRGFYRSSRSFSTATRVASHTTRSGGHGGYGGGGRGGGGGGGGH